jgi:hypothetical protein
MKHTHPEKSFNISRWALEHDALTRFLMIVLMLLGVTAYFQLGQDEDPPFTFRAMVVRTYWPGATAQQVAEQVTDKIERTLQEVPYADKIRSYSKPGESQIIFQIKDSSKAADVPNVWYTVRKKVADMKGTLPQGVVGPFFNDEFGDVYGVIYALESDGFSDAEVKTFADDVRQKLLRVPCRRRWTWSRCAWRDSSTPSKTSRPCRSGAALGRRFASRTSPTSAVAMSIRRSSRCAIRAGQSSRWGFRWPRVATSLRWARR